MVVLGLPFMRLWVGLLVYGIARVTPLSVMRSILTLLIGFAGGLLRPLMCCLG
jgi:hypothetical protein